MSYFLIFRKSTGSIHICTQCELGAAAMLMQMDELDIARDIEECGRCDTDTHTLIPVEAFK